MLRGLTEQLYKKELLSMNYLVLLCDGMADYPLPELGGLTPMEAAIKPNMDRLAAMSEVGLVKSVADGLKPGSDVANLSVLGYDPAKCYSGRSPLEAGSIGIDMKPTDVSFRCNLVTLSDEPCYEDKTMVDYCAGDISTAEAAELIKTLKEHFDSESFTLYSGVSYRHCLIWKNGTLDVGSLTPPHDISLKPIRNYLPSHENTVPLLRMMKESYDILMSHPINRARIEKGLRPANSMWFWGEGVRKPLEQFYDRFGLKASMISAVDLLKGIGKFTGMNVVSVEGATGYIDTNFEGKARAAVEEFKLGSSFVYVHVEAPDECGHRHEIENKVKSIELIDQLILGPVVSELSKLGDYCVMVLPDHATPLSLMTHTNDPIPYMIYSTRTPNEGVDCFCERTARDTGRYVPIGHTLIDHLLTDFK